MPFKVIPGDLAGYLALVTTEHADKPKYMAMLSLVFEPFCDNIATVSNLASRYFDIDTAIGQQLDILGQWIGRTRNVDLPLNIYFAFDTPGLGFDEGVWKGPFDPDTGAISLPDDLYRLLLKATIITNTWDGSIEELYEAWSILLNNSANTTDSFVLIQDWGHNEMGFILMGNAAPSDLTMAFFKEGITTHPAGVKLKWLLPTVYPAGVPGGTPVFGFDVQNERIAGFDTGAWAQKIQEI